MANVGVGYAISLGQEGGREGGRDGEGDKGRWMSISCYFLRHISFFFSYKMILVNEDTQ